MTDNRYKDIKKDLVKRRFDNAHKRAQHEALMSLPLPKNHKDAKDLGQTKRIK